MKSMNEKGMEWTTEHQTGINYHFNLNFVPKKCPVNSIKYDKELGIVSDVHNEHTMYIWVFGVN